MWFVVIRYYGLRYNYRLLLLVMFDYADKGDYAIFGRCYSRCLITLSSRWFGYSYRLSVISKSAMPHTGSFFRGGSGASGDWS